MDEDQRISRRDDQRLLYDIDADTYQTAIEKGVTVNATARMTDDCRRGIAKFLEK